MSRPYYKHKTLMLCTCRLSTIVLLSSTGTTIPISSNLPAFNLNIYKKCTSIIKTN